MSPLVEVALWPCLYFKREWCESVVYAPRDWQPLCSAARKEDKVSSKSFFAWKLRGPILDYGADIGFIQFQFDRHIVRDLLSRTRIAASHSMSASLATAEKSWSPRYWRDHHRALVDVVRQIGYPH
eukprot:5001488-Pyramimonas_sp.AAC.1